MLDLHDQINNAFLERLGTGVARTPPILQPRCFIMPRMTYPVGLKALNLIYPVKSRMRPLPKGPCIFLLKEDANLQVEKR